MSTESGPPHPCADGGGDCCASSGTPGCDDPECCGLVCATDPFCCETGWDDICVDVATTACAGCVAAPCEVLCSEDGVAEQEACGDDDNGGCNGTPAGYEAVACGTSVCGTSWAEAGVRDTDWFGLTLTDASTEVTATLVSEFDGVVSLVDGLIGCAPVVVGETGASNGCEADAPAAATLTPGTYAIFVSTVAFEGIPCGGTNDYVLQIATTHCATPLCPADTNDDGVVAVADLVNLVTLWGSDGQAPGIDADIDDDGVVGVGDLTEVLLSWGICP